MAAAMASPWKLFIQALRDYREHWRLLTGVIAVVSVPVAILTALNVVDASSNTTTAAYVGFAQVAMNTATIYAIIRIVQNQAPLPSIRSAYYKGSDAFLRLFLVSVLLVLMLLFLLLGLFIVAVGAAAPGVQIGPAEQGLLIGLALLLSLPSIWLVPRSLWAVYIVFESDMGPIQAVRTSWKLTVGRTWSALGYSFALVIFLSGVLAVPLIALFALENVTKWPVWAPLIQLAATFIIVPISNLYLYRYLRNMRVG